MHKKSFAVIGHPIGHTMSPFIHKKLFQLAEIEADYNVIDIAPEDLEKEFQHTLCKLDGFNVTIPHKTAIIPLLDATEGSARFCGSVNTVKTGQKNKGYTTDSIGFLRALETSGIKLGGRVLILGAGGVSRTIAYEAVRAGVELTVTTRENSMEKARHMAEEITSFFSGSHINICTAGQAEGEFDLLINATPVGMYPNTDASPAPAELIGRCNAVFDTVYNPSQTLLLKTAQDMGIKCAGGMSMLVWQAAAAQEIWLDTAFDPAHVSEIISLATSEMKHTFSSGRNA